MHYASTKVEINLSKQIANKKGNKKKKSRNRKHNNKAIIQPQWVKHHSHGETSWLLTTHANSPRRVVHSIRTTSIHVENQHQNL